VKSQGKKLPSSQILEVPDELPDNLSGESSTLETLKQESSLSTCAHSTDEDGDVPVVEVRLEDPKVRSRLKVFLLVQLSELSYVLSQRDFKL